MSILDKLFHSGENEKNKDESKKKPAGEEPKEGEAEAGSEEHPHKHSKWHDALQQWANDNERDIEEDDSDALKSGL